MKPTAYQRGVAAAGVANPIQLGTLRGLALEGAVQSVELIGVPGGFALAARCGLSRRTLVSAKGSLRIFRASDSVLALVRDQLGIETAAVNLARWDAVPSAAGEAL